MSWQGSVFPYLLNRSATETAIDSGIPAVLPALAQLLLFVCPVPLLFPAAMADSRTEAASSAAVLDFPGR